MKTYDSVDGEVIGSDRFKRRRVVRKAYERLRILSVPVGESMTSQDQKDAADINFLMSRFARTGVLPGADRPGVFQDNTVVPDNLGDAIMVSRSTIDAANSGLEAFRLKQADEAKAKAEAERLELEALRAEKAANTPKPPSQ